MRTFVVVLRKKEQRRMRLFNIVVLALVAVCVVATRDVPAMWRPHNTKVNRADVIGITVALKRRNVDKLDRIFWDVSDPNSPRYGEHLNNEQMRELVSPGRAVVERVVSWLKENGALEVKVSKHEDSMTARFHLSSLESMLDVKFENFVHAQSGRVIARAMKAPTVPASISEHIELLAGLDGFPINPSRADSHTSSSKITVDPSALFKQYNVSKTPPPTGKRNIVAFFQATGQYVSSSDLHKFCALYTDIPSDRCVVSRYIGENRDDSPGTESDLDVQYLLAMARGLELWVYSYPDPDFCNDLLAWASDVFADASGSFPSVISISYGTQSVPNWCLGPVVARASADIQKMGVMGITVVVASGDDGSGAESRMGPNYGLLGAAFPATVPYCTAVGSTTLTGNVEVASQEFGSGGGFSFDYTVPSFQESFVDKYFVLSQQNLPPKISYPRRGRPNPDVATLGEGFQVVVQGVTKAIRGTSASAPVIAGLVGLLNNVRLQNNKTLGFINPLLYANVGAFTDVVEGDNDVGKDGLGWKAAVGWDPVTGLGTPKFDKLLQLIQTINERERNRH